MKYATALLLLLIVQTASAQRWVYYNEGIFTMLHGHAIPREMSSGTTGVSTSSGVEVVPGEQMTFGFALPQATMMSIDGSVSIPSPVFRMNRLQLDGTPHAAKGTYGGDTLVSPYIVVRAGTKNVLSFSYQRVGKPPGGTYDRTWCSTQLVGPEPRVIKNSDPATAIAEPDKLVVELVGVNTLSAPITDSLWNRHLRADSTYITDNPAFTLFGAGGSRRGFYEQNSDSSLTFADGLRADIYDDGKDQQYRKVYIPIPSWLPQEAVATGPDERVMRFRIRVEATDNGNDALPDDADDFYIDNLEIVSYKPSKMDTTGVDMEVVEAGIVNPYTIMPERQAQSIPVNVRLTNNGINTSSSLELTVQIEPDIPTVNPSQVYKRKTSLPFLRPQVSTAIGLPPLNAFAINAAHDIAGKDSMTYRMTVHVRHVLPDAIPENDSVTTKFTLRFGNVFAYDPPFPPEGKNDVPELSGIKGKGLNFAAKHIIGTDPWEAWQFGQTTGALPGLVAARFVLAQPDTIRGYQAFFGSRNFTDPNYKLSVFFEIQKDIGGKPGNTSLTRVPGSFVNNRNAGYDDLRSPESGGKPVTDEYTTYLLPSPVYLEAGTYWVVVYQPSDKGMELGGSAYRMGLMTTNDYSEAWPGDQNTTLMIDRAFRAQAIDTASTNNCPFVYSNYVGFEIKWKFLANIWGSPTFGYLDHLGTVAGIPTYSRGTIVPMIRPYFGPGKTATSVADAPAQHNALLHISPNPVLQTAVVRFHTATADCVRISILDALGREVACPASTTFARGEHTVQFSADNLPNGVYFCRLETQGTSTTQQFIVAH